MDSVFRSAKEKLEREHRERKENGKLKLEREKKAKDAAERQREAIEASQRERRLESIEAQMKKVEDNLGERKEEDLKHRGGDSSLKVKVSPRLMLEKLMERRGGMRQEAKVEGGSVKQSKEEYFNDDEDVEWDDDEDVEWDDDEDVEGKEDLKAKGGDYSLKVDGGFKEDSKDEYLKAYYYALLNQRGVAKAEEGKASAAANGNCKRWT